MYRIDWDQHENIVLRDINEQWHPRVIEYMKDNYLKKNKLFQKLNYFDDENLYKDYEKCLMHCLKTESSIIAVAEPKEEILAAAILKYNHTTMPNWRTLSVLLDEGKIEEMVQLHCRTILEYYQKHSTTHSPTEASLHIFEYHIIDELKTTEFMNKFFGAITEVARHMKAKRITFLGMQKAEREVIKSMGFNRIKQIIYSLYKYNGTVPFDALRDINEMTASLFEKIVEDVVPYEELPPYIDIRPPQEHAIIRASDPK